MPLLPRHAAPLAREVLDAFPCLMVQGARQVGKSTFAQMLAAERDAVHYTLDDDITRGSVVDDPTTFIGQHPHRTVVIDEIQRAPQLMLAIKAAIDRDRRPGRFILTGSSDLLRVRGTPDSLAGRAVTVELGGFSQGEIEGRRDDFALALHSGVDIEHVPQGDSRQEVVKRIVTGGFPEMQGRSHRLRNAWFDAYVERLARRDVTDANTEVDSDRLLQALRLIAANQAGELVISRLAKDSGIPERTFPRYADLLDVLYLIQRVRPWTPNLTSREIGRSKALVRDSGLAARLSRLSADHLSSTAGAPHLGPLLEGFVLSELTKQQTWTETEFELFHWRDRNGVEVDAVLEFENGHVLGIEVKASATVKPEHFRGLHVLRDKLGDRFLTGVVLSLDPVARQYSERLIGLPVSTLWTL